MQKLQQILKLSKKVLLGGLFLERKSKMIQNIPQSQNAQSPESFDGKETLKGISLKT